MGCSSQVNQLKPRAVSGDITGVSNPDLQDEAAEVAALLAAENVAPVPEGERDRLGPLDALTGAPLPEDVLLFALPVRMHTRYSCTFFR